MKINTNAQRFIDGVCMQLPVDGYSVKDTCKVSGEDVLLSNTNEINGEEVDPEKEYLMNIPRYHSVNHKRRMKRAFKTNGLDGLISYLKKYTKPELHADMSQTVRRVCSR
jgi:hypothetical protein